MSRTDKAIYRLYYTGYDKDYSRKEAMHDLLHARDSYEKAIDKACERLAKADNLIFGMAKDDVVYSRKATKEDWKEWLMKDE